MYKWCIVSFVFSIQLTRFVCNGFFYYNLSFIDYNNYYILIHCLSLTKCATKIVFINEDRDKHKRTCVQLLSHCDFLKSRIDRDFDLNVQWCNITDARMFMTKVTFDHAFWKSSFVLTLHWMLVEKLGKPYVFIISSLTQIVCIVKSIIVSAFI